MTGATMERKQHEETATHVDPCVDVEIGMDELLEAGDIPLGAPRQTYPGAKLGALMSLQSQAVDPELDRRRA